MENKIRYDVLLTYPAENIRLFESMIPLGIASIAAVLEKNHYSVKIVDFNQYKGDFRRDLESWKPKIVGVGGTTPTRKGSFLTARLSKEILPGVPVVYGGVHASFTAQDTLEHVQDIDYVVKGEGEYTFLALCEKFVRNRLVKICSLEGLCYRSDGVIQENRHARIHDLDALPIPARHLFDTGYSMALDCNNAPADFIMTSRGCPAGCSFCSASRMFPGGVRLRSMHSIKKEIDGILSNKPIRALKIFDSTFTANKSHTLDFCNLIRPYNLLWECEIRADSVDYDLLRQMKSAGCCSIDVGLETTNEKLLKKMGKNIKLQQIERVLSWCRDLDIKTKVFFTFGHLGQTYNDCVRDLSYIRKKRTDIDFYATTIGIRVYPGTALEKQLKKHHVLPKKFSWARFVPPLKNLILLEPSDVLLLEQANLSFFRLFTLIVRLCMQGTILSTNYIGKMIVQNVNGCIELIQAQFRYTRHRFERLIINIFL